MSERDGPPGLPDHEQQAWDAIVAGLQADQPAGQAKGDDRGQTPPGPRDHVPPADDDIDALDALDALEDTDEPGYVPPEPPPLPRPDDAIGRASWAAVIGGPILVVVSRGLGWDSWISHAGLALAIGGFVSLVWRMKDRDDGDDGAVV